MLNRIAACALLLLCAVTFLSAQTCVVPPSGLVSWWPGDTNENDLVGGNNASVVNSVSLVAAEVLDGFTFGTLGYLSIPQATNLENEQFSWTTWVRPDGAGPNDKGVGSIIIDQNIDGSHAAVQLSWRDSDGRFIFVFGNANSDLITSTDAFTTGNFYSVAGTYDGGTFRLYVNGILEGSLAETKTVPYSSKPWIFGGGSPDFYPAFGHTWNGVIDEIQAFSRALTQSELQAIYNAGAAGECKVPSIGAGGVVSASAFGEFPAASPGSWVEIYGTILAVDARGWEASDFQGINAPTALEGTSVTVAGQPAFVDSISPGQVDALLPSNIPTGTQQLAVTTPYGTASYDLTVNAVQPGLLAPPNFNVGGTQYVVAQFADGTYALAAGAIAGLNSRPAVAGDILVIYGIGFGPVTPSIPAGQLVGESNTLSSDFQIAIGGVQCQVQYDGLAPSYTGLYQFNIVVPDVPSGNQPLTFTVDGINGTQTLYVAVGS